jgi:hypothetical protein
MTKTNPQITQIAPIPKNKNQIFFRFWTHHSITLSEPWALGTLYEPEANTPVFPWRLGGLAP